MADNLNISTASGTVAVATDNVSNVHYQVFKLGHGAPDAVDSHAGAFAAAGDAHALPVTNYPASDFMSVGGLALVPKFASIDASSSGDNTIVAAVSGKKIRVVALHVTMTGTLVTIAFESGASGTAITGDMTPLKGNSITLPFCPVGWFETTSGVLLNMELGGSQAVAGCLTYIEV